MKIVAIEQELPGRTAEDFMPHLEAEAKKVWELYQKGLIREIYFRDDQKSAVLMLECESLQQAIDILSDLPLVRENLITFDCIPLKPYPGFERLFK